MQLNRNEQGQAGIAAILAFMGVALVIGLIMLFNSLASTPADKVGVVWSGGPLDGKHYVKTLDPGSALTNIGVFNRVYEYPTTQRTYIADPENDRADLHGTISTVTKDNVEVHWRVNTYFKLNTGKLDSFQKNIGFKYSAWEDAGWDQMLNDVFRPQIENALQTASRKYTVEELYSNQDVIIAVQAEVASDLQANVNNVLGDDYFCGPGYIQGKSECPAFKFLIPKKPGIPDGISGAFETNKESEVAVKTASNVVLVKRQEAEGIRVLANATRDAGPAYLELKRIEAQQTAAANGGIFYVPYGSNIMVNPGK